ncbi:ABC transporter permease [Rhizobium sp. LjRoot98]|uniref:ABC transporter permease n=1 Tax=unclassified Rhizobium TaxID=2613769 RepID=UPI0007124122|nr:MULTISPECIES: ABC transporter permease [unclassified Rhizobium]KQV40290.1 polyamine ABC transporter permease [Rhizobium sp. Root1204]KQY02652.1 polyamine ABC transporter permease [Rhizobium sp. Root1334]KRB99264.1 polyamine ABC transporter permease [Rhizobium sp. Root73]
MKSDRLKPALLLGPLVLFLGFAYLVPFLGVMQWSVTLPEPGFGQYGKAVTDPLIQSVFFRTFRICLIVTICAVAAAYAIAYVWVRGTPAQRLVTELCILIPFWISVLTRAFGWVALLSNRGLINTWLQATGIISEPLTMVRNEFGVVLGMMHFLIPFAVFPIASAMRSLDERVFLAARGMGASRLRIFWSIFVPMTMPGILGAGLMVFVFALGFFITPAILGGGRSVMIAELIYLRLFQSPDWGLGAAISVILMLIVGALLILMLRLVRPNKMLG